MIYLDDPNFLPIIQIPNLEHNFKFLGTDTEKEFAKNLASQPSTWYYRTHEVHYDLNSQGYRTKDWNEINWKESVVIFGASDVLGVGLSEEDTISSVLSTLLNCPVINLGVGASSMQFSFYNSLILHKHYPTPRAIVNIWTNSYRTTFFGDKSPKNIGAWDSKSRLFQEWSASPGNPSNYAASLAYSSSIIWKDIGYYEASFFEETSDLLNCDFFPTVDKARDLSHPGKESAYEAAMRIYKSII